MKVKLALVMILTSLAVILIAQNVAPVEVEFFYWQASMSRALLILLVLFIGFVLGWFWHGYAAYRRSGR